MKYLKALGLLALAVAGLMTVAAGASATPGTTITSPTGTVATPTIKAESEGGHLSLQNPIKPIECSSAIEAKVESHGAKSPVLAKVNSFSLTGCTSSWHATAVSLGELAIEWTSGYNGSITSTGLKVDATRLGVTCVYETSATKLGTLTGGTPATIHVEAAIPVNTKESSGLCGSSASKLEGSYKLSSPESLFVEEGVSGTTITSPTGTVATPTIKAESEGGHLSLQNPIKPIECSSAIEAKVESHGAKSPVLAKVNSFSLTGCTSSWHATAVSLGELAIEWTSGYNGSITSTGLKVDATRLGVTCVYETSATKLGTLTGGTPATIHVEAAIPVNTKESSGLCGSSASKLEGSYKLSSPESLFVEEA